MGTNDRMIDDRMIRGSHGALRICSPRCTRSTPLFPQAHRETRSGHAVAGRTRTPAGTRRRNLAVAGRSNAETRRTLSLAEDAATNDVHCLVTRLCVLNLCAAPRPLRRCVYSASPTTELIRFSDCANRVTGISLRGLRPVHDHSACRLAPSSRRVQRRSLW